MICFSASSSSSAMDDMIERLNVSPWALRPGLIV
jgi:hypothetical protein